MTSNTLAVQETATGSQLALQDGQTFFTDMQVATLRQIGMNGAGKGDLEVFFHQVQRTGLDPFAKQIYMINRQGKWTIQTGIDGFRLIASRVTMQTGGTLGYEDTLWMDNNGNWLEVWPHDYPPIAAKVTVLRNGGRFPAVAMFQEYVGLKRDGKPNQMWSTKGALMIAKCAEALALRKAFPQDMSGIYVTEEMHQADNNGRHPQPTQQAAQRTQNASNEVNDALNRGPAQAAPQQPVEDTLALDENGYPMDLSTGDTEEDFRLHQVIGAIKKAEDLDALKELHRSLYATFQGIHAAAFIHALNAREAEQNRESAQ